MQLQEPVEGLDCLRRIALAQTDDAQQVEGADMSRLALERPAAQGFRFVEPALAIDRDGLLEGEVWIGRAGHASRTVPIDTAGG